MNAFLGRACKAVLDKVGALIGIALFSPVFIILIVAIKRDGGPALYTQPRIGMNGKPFDCWKFRTMHTNAGEILQDILARNPEAKTEWELGFKLKNDPRITRIGYFLRKTSLDELPQLYNVLRGEMSLVGPRPIVKAEEPYYGDNLDLYCSVRPGITGLWQVSGRNDVPYPQRVAMDCRYIRNWSIWHDFIIIFKTIPVVLCRKGAY